MKMLVTGEKLLRLNYLAANRSDAKQLATRLKQRYEAATSIAVSDIGGLSFHYIPTVDSIAQRPLFIPKKFVEDFNIALTEATAPVDLPNLDLDSIETLKSQLDAWIDSSAMPVEAVFTSADTVEFLSAAGSLPRAQFVYGFTAGALYGNSFPRQKLLATDRVSILSQIGDDETTPDYTISDGVVVVATPATADVLATIVAAAKNAAIPDPAPGEETTFTAYSTPRLFAEDLELPWTHFVSGRSYVAKISEFALDYYGTIEFRIA